MIEIKNLLFQPLTFHLAGDGQGLHLSPRERKSIGNEQLSPEIEVAAKRGLISLTKTAKPPEASAKTGKSPAKKSKTKPKGDGTQVSRRTKRR
ncbi:hypothetical protein DSCW_51620 [Desulfosarcina widdelii]|uniref:Uncharacterized protein n=1 Tax=Desulfosarcina widdelii TaxID=947919 RepID=A0A5K7ZAJ7_9BACT|nr:hypothetical protein [Desulfosarcina widdelii]BBO77745.1 hypothetical protein DSCW_51620 [Desulfosarcina widdelii]